MREIKKRYGNALVKISVIIFWLLVWQAISMLLDDNILLASPAETIRALVRLVQTDTFRLAVLWSFLRITAGFFTALAAGIGLAVAAYRFRIVKELVTPLIKLIKAMPVVSFVIIALLWITSENLPILISFLMVLPVIYISIYNGIKSTDGKLLEMAKVFGMPGREKLRMIYMPAVSPHFVSACSVGLGFCWKSGIAAEVIGLSAESIGRQLYDAKLYLLTDELFAWTAVIILISIIFEKAVMRLIRYAFGEKKKNYAKSR